MENAIARYTNSVLPQFKGQFSYNDMAKMFLSNGYASAAGNVYQSGLRISRHLAVQFSIGHGYAHSFLNGISIFIWDKDRPKVVSQKSFSCFFWNESDTIQVLKGMIKDYVKGECLRNGYGEPAELDLENLSSELVKELEQETAVAAKQLAASVTKQIQ